MFQRSGLICQVAPRPCLTALSTPEGEAAPCFGRSSKVSSTAIRTARARPVRICSSIAAPAPAAATISPARAGPTMKAALMLAPSKALAASSSSTPATSGRTAEKAPEESGEVAP